MGFPWLTVIGSVCVGAVVHWAAVVFFGARLAAFAFPLLGIGSPGDDVAVLPRLAFSLGWSPLVAAAVALGTAPLLIAVRHQWRQAAYGAFFGMLGSYAYAQLQFVQLLLKADPTTNLQSATLRAFSTSWFYWPTVVAPWAGLALAVWVAGKARARSMNLSP